MKIISRHQVLYYLLRPNDSSHQKTWTPHILQKRITAVFWKERISMQQVNCCETMQPDTLNQSSKEVNLSLSGNLEIIYSAVCMANGVSSLAAILGNFAALGTIWRTASLHSPSHIFLFGLALSDFGVGLFVQPMFIVFLVIQLKTATYNAHYWNLFRFVQAVFVAATALTLTTVSVDKLMALTFHLKYNAVLTIKRACIVLFLIWIASIGYGSTLLFSRRLHRDLNIVIFTSCLVVNSVAYFVIYRIARRHRLQIHKQAQVLAQPGKGNLNMKNYRKSVISMLFIFILFLICYVPYLFVRVFTHFALWNPIQIGLALRLSVTIVYFNSCLNPLIYCWRMRELRRGMKNFLKTLC